MQHIREKRPMDSTKDMIIFEGGVTSAAGFSAAGISAGIKKNGNPDMAMLMCEVPCTCAGTFTSNLVKAAPVKWDQNVIREHGMAQAVVVNSGVANACTGEEGMEACRKISEEAGSVLKIDPALVLTASTGVIGIQLPMDKILSGIGTLSTALARDAAHGTAAATAIMTTDTKKKEIAVRTVIGGKEVTIGGMSKGSGMIHPNMCTMLSFVTTDCAISAPMLQEALSRSVKKSYNMISVDGDTSTNDTCILMASQLAGNPVIDSQGSDFETFCTALDEVNIWLARHMAADGEGATCLFEVKMCSAASYEQAVKLAKSVVSSSLVKTAIAGHDANWGRIVCAMGYSGADFDPDKVDLYFENGTDSLQIIHCGIDTGYSEEKATEILSSPEVTARIELNQGTSEATAWGCDLTHEYIAINADYRS